MEDRSSVQKTGHCLTWPFVCFLAVGPQVFAGTYVWINALLAG